MPKLTVRLADPSHPNGQRVRAGITFTVLPVTIEVSARQAADIMADTALTVSEAEEATPSRKLKRK